MKSDLNKNGVSKKFIRRMWRLLAKRFKAPGVVRLSKMMNGAVEVANEQ
jgi:hypothetical protein